MSAFLRGMGRTTLLFVFFTFFSFFAKGQGWTKPRENKYKDSLLSILRGQSSDSVKSAVCYQLSQSYLLSDSIKARPYLLKGRELGRRYRFLQAAYFFYEGQFYMDSNPDRAAQLFLKADKELSVLKYQSAYSLRAISWAYYAAAKIVKGTMRGYIDVMVNKVLPLSEKGGDITMIIEYNYRVGMFYMVDHQPGKSVRYFNYAIDLLKPIPAGFNKMLRAYLWCVNNYVRLAKYDNAKLTLDKVERLLWPYPVWSKSAHYYYNESLYGNIDDYDQALDSLLRERRAGKQIDEAAIKRMLLLKRHQMLIEAKQYELAKTFLEDQIKSRSLMADLESRKIVYDQMVKANAGIGLMDEAYQWAKAYTKLVDSIHESRLEERLSAMEVKYRNAENQRKIVQLEAENERALLYSKNTRLVIVLLAIAMTLILVLAAFGFYYYLNRSKLMATNAMLEGEERERKRVARELHDGLGGMLAGVKIKLSAWGAGQSGNSGNAEFEKIVSELDNSVKELRYISRNLMPESLLRFGLETALKDLCESVMTEKQYIDFQAFQIQDRLALNVQLSIYRIVQELLSNAIRHANAGNIIVQCSQNRASFFITVEDDGKGFNPAKSDEGNSMGLMNIRNRVEFLKGKMYIESVIDEGTIVNIELLTDI